MTFGREKNTSKSVLGHIFNKLFLFILNNRCRTVGVFGVVSTSRNERTHFSSALFETSNVPIELKVCLQSIG